MVVRVAVSYQCKAAPSGHLPMENPQQEKQAKEAPKSEAEELTELKAGTSEVEKTFKLPKDEKYDALRRELDTQKAETRSLYAEVLDLENRNEEGEIELRQLRRERDGLLGEKLEMEKRLEKMMEESASIVSSLVTVQSDMEEQMERRARDGRISTGRAISILKNAERAISMSGEIKEEDGGDEVGEELVRKFAVGLEAIDRNFRSKLEKMEEMKRKVELLKGSVEEETRKRRRI